MSTAVFQFLTLLTALALMILMVAWGASRRLRTRLEDLEVRIRAETPSGRSPHSQERGDLGADSMEADELAASLALTAQIHDLEKYESKFQSNLSKQIGLDVALARRNIRKSEDQALDELEKNVRATVSQILRKRELG